MLLHLRTDQNANRLSPAVAIRALAAERFKLPESDICFRNSHVARFAGDFFVCAFQRKFGIAIVIEFYRLPIFFAVAAGAIGAAQLFSGGNKCGYKLTVVFVRVTVLAILRHILERNPVVAGLVRSRNVAFNAVGAVVFAEQCKIGLAVIEFDAPPAIHAMATFAAVDVHKFPRFAEMGIFVAIDAFCRNKGKPVDPQHRSRTATPVRRTRVTGDAGDGTVRAFQRIIRFRVIIKCKVCGRKPFDSVTIFAGDAAGTCCKLPEVKIGVAIGAFGKCQSATRNTGLVAAFAGNGSVFAAQWVSG